MHWVGNNIALGLDLEGSVEPYEMCLWIVFEGGLASCVCPNAKQSCSLSEARRQGVAVQSCLRLVIIVVAAARGQEDLKWHMRGLPHCSYKWPECVNATGRDSIGIYYDMLTVIF